MLVGTNNSQVNDQVFEVRSSDSASKRRLQIAFGTPSAEAAEDAVLFAKQIKQVAPGRASQHNPEHTLDRHPDIPARRAFLIRTADHQRGTPAH